MLLLKSFKNDSSFSYAFIQICQQIQIRKKKKINIYSLTCLMVAIVTSCSCLILSYSETPWIVACQTPLSMEFFWQEYRSGQPFPSPGCLPDPGIKPGSPALQSDSLLSEPPEKGQSPVLAGWFFNSSTTREALNNCQHLIQSFLHGYRHTEREREIKICFGKIRS